MNDRSEQERISAEWTRVGGGFTTAPAAYPVDIEALLVHSARQAPADYRLFFVAATWLGIHHQLVDVRRLGRKLGALDGLPSAVAGALVSVANEVAHADRLGELAHHCAALQEPRALFDRVNDDPLLRSIAQADSLPHFSRWGLWHDEISLKHGAIRPIGWIFEHCPELRVRALLGANLDAQIVGSLFQKEKTIAALARTAEASYAATHEAAARLRARGLIQPASGGAYRTMALVPSVERLLREMAGEAS